MTPSPDPTALALTSPDALVAALPYLVGFPPYESGVILWLRGRRLLLTQRLDLPPQGDDMGAWLDAAWGHLAAQEADEIVIAVVSGRADITRLAAALADVASVRGVDVRDQLVLHEGRWRSLLCTDEQCCPSEGRTIDEQVAAHVAAEFTGAGLSPVAAREALVAELEQDPVRSALVAECAAARPRRQGPAHEQARDEAIDAFLAALDAGSDGRGAGDPSLEEVTALLAGLDDVRVRDTVLWEVSHAGPDRQLRALRQFVSATRQAPPGLVAPVATCAAVASWLVGDGARAQVALDRALRDRPDYSLALLVQHSVRIGLPPRAWREAMHGLTREQCRHGGTGERARAS